MLAPVKSGLPHKGNALLHSLPFSRPLPFSLLCSAASFSFSTRSKPLRRRQARIVVPRTRKCVRMSVRFLLWFPSLGCLPFFFFFLHGEAVISSVPRPVDFQVEEYCSPLSFQIWRSKNGETKRICFWLEEVNLWGYRVEYFWSVRSRWMIFSLRLVLRQGKFSFEDCSSQESVVNWRIERSSKRSS